MLCLGKGQITYALLTRAPVVLLPLDLHVLGTPPAFVLSQDQTLHRNRDHIPPNPKAWKDMTRS